MNISVCGQTGFFGSVKNENGEKLFSANIYLSNSLIGTSSQENGEYRFILDDISPRQDTLIVTYLGFEPFKKPVTILGIQRIDIELKESTANLQEVAVFAEKPKLTPLQIIKKARRKVGKNYVNQTIVQEGFYREKLVENGITREINEGIIDFKSSGYPSTKFSKSSFTKYWDDVFGNKLQNLRSNFVQWWPLFITEKDKVNVLHTRVSNDYRVKGDRLLGAPFGGPIDVIALNSVKYGLDFLNPKLTKKYAFKIIAVDSLKGDICYTIDYQPKQELPIWSNDKIYQHHFGKKVRSTLFRGQVVVRKSDFAIINFSSESIDWHRSINVRDNSEGQFYLSFYPNRISYKANFEESENGLILESIHYESNYNLKIENNPNLKWHRDLWLSKPTDKAFDENTIAYFPERRRTIRERTTRFDRDVWSGFEKSDLFVPLTSRETKDLEYLIPLDEQFELVNRPVYEIPLPSISTKGVIDEQSLEVLNQEAFNLILKEENQYANSVLQKLNNYQRSFQPNRVLAFDFKEPSYKKKHRYFGQADSLGIYYYYENLDDSTVIKIFNLSEQNQLNIGAQIEELNFTESFAIFKLDFLHNVPSSLKVISKGENKAIDSIPNIYNFEILNDSMLVYSSFENNRPSKLFLHKIGKKEDRLLIHENDIEYDIELSKTTSNQYVVVTVESKDQNEISIINCSTGELKDIFPRREKVVSSLDHFNQDNFFVSLCSSYDYHIVKTEIGTSESDTLYSSSKIIEDFYLYKNKLLVTQYDMFDMEMRLIDLDKGEKKVIDPQKEINTLSIIKHEKDTDSLYFYAESSILPVQTFRLSLKTGKYDLIDEEKFGYTSDKHDYRSEVIEVKTNDGETIPILISYDKVAIKDSITAILINVYGAYGSKSYSTFDQNEIAFMQKGVIMAKAAVRGSGVKGLKWYEDGKLLQKENTFSDFIQAARRLREIYNLKPKQVFARGVSAGGIVMGVMANRYPEDFGGLILDRPFLDVYGRMNDSTKYLTTIEYAEWGDPKVSPHGNYIHGYSPFQNIGQRSQTNLFFRASQFDEITTSAQIAKNAMKYRENSTSDNLILFKIREGEGHMVLYNYKDAAEEYAFMMYAMRQQ